MSIPQFTPELEAAIATVADEGCYCDLMIGFICGIHNAIVNLREAIDRWELECHG